MHTPAAFDSSSLEEYKKTGKLNSDILSTAYLAKYYFDNPLHRVNPVAEMFFQSNKSFLLKAHGEIQEIQKSATQWEAKNWFPTLQKVYQKSVFQGFRGTHKDFLVLMHGMAGRVMIGIHDHESNSQFDGSWVTMIFDADADYSRCGLQGISGTKEHLLKLLELSFNDLPDVKEDNEVSLEIN